MSRRKDAGVNPDLPVTATITITGECLSDVQIGLLDIAGHFTSNYTSGEVKADKGRHDGYEFKVTQL